MEWGIIAGIIAGTVSGVGSSLVSPWAARRQEDARLKTEARRQRIADWRAMVAQGNTEGWGIAEIAADPRMAALRSHLQAGLKDRYFARPRTLYVEENSGTRFRELSEAIDDLEHRWRLI